LPPIVSTPRLFVLFFQLPSYWTVTPKAELLLFITPVRGPKSPCLREVFREGWHSLHTRKLVFEPHIDPPGPPPGFVFTFINWSNLCSAFPGFFLERPLVPDVDGLHCVRTLWGFPRLFFELLVFVPSHPTAILIGL